MRFLHASWWTYNRWNRYHNLYSHTHWRNLVTDRPWWTVVQTWRRRWPSWPTARTRWPTPDRIPRTQGQQWEWLAPLCICWSIFYARKYGCTGRWPLARRRQTTGTGRTRTAWGAARLTRGRSERRKYNDVNVLESERGRT